MENEVDNVTLEVGVVDAEVVAVVVCKELGGRAFVTSRNGKMVVGSHHPQKSNKLR